MPSEQVAVQRGTERDREREGQWGFTGEFKLAFSPKRATAELRHSSSMGNRASQSPRKRDDVGFSPSLPGSPLADEDDYRGRHPRDRIRSLLSTNLQSMFPFLFADRSHLHNSKIFFLFGVVIIIAVMISAFSIFNRLVSHPLCK